MKVTITKTPYKELGENLISYKGRFGIQLPGMYKGKPRFQIRYIVLGKRGFNTEEDVIAEAKKNGFTDVEIVEKDFIDYDQDSVYLSF